MSEINEKNLEQVTGGDGGATGGWGEEPVFEKVKLGCPKCFSTEFTKRSVPAGPGEWDTEYKCSKCGTTFKEPAKMI